MPYFVLMTKLSPEAMRDARGMRRKGKDWMSKVKEHCPDVKWVAHYALLGQYDFMDIYEAESVQTAHRVSIITRSEGALNAESWQAIPYDEHLKLLEQVQP
jgi:uncharacterized protein with GYD domain